MMRPTTLSFLAALLVGGVTGHADAAGSASARCDPACLEHLLDQYLTALVAHDPSRLPLARTVKYTENGQILKLDDGMWGPASGLGGYRIAFADPEAGQVGCLTVIEENGHPALVGLRLKVENRTITEIEAIVARKAHDAWVKPEDLVDQPIFREPLAPPERRSRRELIAITNSYFEGLEQATDKLTPFAPNCTRVENGNITANNPAGPSPIHKLSVGEQFATGFSKFITRIRDRRFPVVDEERGLVFAVILFDHAGTVKTVTLADGTTFTVPPPYDTPYTFLIGELFKIKDGRISRIEAVLLPVPYGMPSGWGGSP